MSPRSNCLCIATLLIILVKGSEGDSFADQVLEAHNRYRAIHDAPPLTLDENLNALAQDWAEHLASIGGIGHRPDTDYGENVWSMSSSNPRFTVKGDVPVKSWYDEIRHYTYGGGSSGRPTGHFTQVVWKSSRRLGVGMARRGGSVYVVCNYDPAGNFGGQYASQVGRPNGSAPESTKPDGGDESGSENGLGESSGLPSGFFGSFGFGGGSENPFSGMTKTSGPMKVTRFGSFGGAENGGDPFSNMFGSFGSKPMKSFGSNESGDEGDASGPPASGPFKVIRYRSFKPDSGLTTPPTPGRPSRFPSPSGTDGPTPRIHRQVTVFRSPSMSGGSMDPQALQHLTSQLMGSMPPLSGAGQPRRVVRFGGSPSSNSFRFR